jgi:DNA-binding NarL/FixJ family response regulator
MRVLVMDPQPVVREGLTSRLEALGDLHVVGTCGDPRTLLLMAESLTPDVVVVEPDLERGDGVAAIADLRRRLSRGSIVVFTTLLCWRSIGRARRAGATGFVLKTDPVISLADAIRAVARGQTFWSLSLPPGLRDWIDRAPDVLSALSDREREVFHLVVQGFTNRRIGRQLFISPKTVDSHRGRILDKLGCRSAVELVRFAFVNGLVRDSEASRSGHPPCATGLQLNPDHESASQSLQ